MECTIYKISVSSFLSWSIERLAETWERESPGVARKRMVGMRKQ